MTIENKEYLLSMQSKLRVSLPPDMIVSLLEKSKPEINEALIKFKQSGPVVVKPKLTVTDALLKLITQNELDRIEDELEAVTSNIRHKETRFQEYQDELRRIMYDIRQSTIRRDRLIKLKEAGVSEIPDEIMKVFANPFYAGHQVQESDMCIRMLTANDVIITYGNFFVNFGTFEIRLSLREGWVTVKPFKNNIFLGNFFHPFMSSGGSPCFGEQADLAAGYLKNQEFSKYFELLSTLLTTFDEQSNPYRQFAEFDKEYKRKNPTAKKVDFCVTCGQRLAFCICGKCPNCKAPTGTCNCTQCECGNWLEEDETCPCTL